MLSGYRRIALLLLLPGLAACGFHPLYGSNDGTTGAQTEAELATIRVNTIADRQGQKLRNYLIDDLQGEDIPPKAEHELSVIYSESEADLGLNNDATTTRGQLTIGATFTLRSIATGKVEMTNSSQQITGYNIQNSEFATILSRDDAEDRALKSIADNLALRLALYFRNVRLHRDTAPAGTPAPQPATGIQPAPTTEGQTVPFASHAPGSALDNQTPITQTP